MVVVASVEAGPVVVDPVVVGATDVVVVGPGVTVNSTDPYSRVSWGPSEHRAHTV